MVNSSLLPKNFTWYSASKTSAEEIDLYFRLISFGHFANLPDQLYFYRQLPQSLSHINPKKTFWLTLQSRFIALQNGYQPSLLATILNLAQIITIFVIPTPLICQLWNIVRGITKSRLSSHSVTFARLPV
jgi:hypothetical protein